MCNEEISFIVFIYVTFSFFLFEYIFGNHQNSYSMKKKIVLTLLCIILVVFFVFGLVLGSFDFTRSKIIEKTDYYLVGWMSARNSLLGVISQR